MSTQGEPEEDQSTQDRPDTETPADDLMVLDCSA